MPGPLDRLYTRGPRTSIPVSLESPGGSVSGKKHDLERTGEIGKARFNDRLKRKLRERLPDIVGDVIGKVPIDGSGDKDVINVHLPPEQRPIFQRGENSGEGYGSGEGEPGDIVAPGPNGNGRGRRGGHGQEGDGGYDIPVPAEELLKMIFEDWELPDMEEKASGEMTEDTPVFNDTRKSQAPQTDWRRSAKRAIARTAATKKNDPNYEHGLKIITDENGNKKHVIDWRPDEDLQRKVWTTPQKPITNAVVYAMRDVSGSIGEEETYAANVMLSWTVRFLKTQYDKVEIVFGFHHSSAKINVTEEQFFNPGESGGTDLIPALELINKDIDRNHPTSDWNIYPFYVGDGEIFESPNNPDLVKSFTELTGKSRRLFYAQTSMMEARYPQWYGGNETNLMKLIQNLNDPHIISAKITDKASMKKGLDSFFKKKEGREGAVPRS